MKHALRKYLSPCGSALFMVVSTMAALIVMVTAMYMSVLSSRQVQFATFDQEQTYVTSTSLGDMVYSYITNDLLTTGGSDPVVSALVNLKKGESVSTNGNDFKAFGGANDDDERLGAYDVTMTYVYDLDSKPVYDIAVTVEKNGVFETTHDFIIIESDGEMNMRRIDNFFTSTGYLPGDIWISKVRSDSKMYFDNEYVKMSTHGWGNGSQDIEYNFDITALGSFEIDVQRTSNVSRDIAPLTWVIGKDLTISAANFNIDQFGKSDNRGKVIVGRDFTSTADVNSYSVADYTDLYILGDAYINSPLTVKTNGNIYIKGNLYTSNFPNENNFYSEPNLSHIFVNGEAFDSAGNKKTFGTWDPAEITTEYNRSITPSQWPAWSVASNPTNIDVNFGIENDKHKVNYIETSGTLDKNWEWPQEKNLQVIVIDTGEDETDVTTLTLSNNCTVSVWDASQNKNVVKKCFNWRPNGNGPTYVLTVGKGSLVLNLPEDVVYQENVRVFIGNLAWFTTLGGTVQSTGKHSNEFSIDLDNCLNDLPTKIKEKNFIYDADDMKMYDPSKTPEQNEANGACIYEKVTSYVTINGNIEARTHYTCKTHGGWYDVDSKESGKCSEIENYYKGECDSLCIGRINKKAFDEYYNNEGSTAKQQLITFYKNYYGLTDEQAAKYIYPNVNIFLASDSENAQIYFGGSEYNYNTEINNTVYFGYVYAPYMTFAFAGNGSETALRAMGGLVVSDLILKSGTGYLFAQPDVSIPGLVGENWKALSALTDKTWHVSHGGT